MKSCPTCKRPYRHDKTAEQRNKFHAICREIGKAVGETPGHIKTAIKIDHFGIDEFLIRGKWYRDIKSSEDTDRVEYSELIEAAYRWAAEREIYISEAA